MKNELSSAIENGFTAQLMKRVTPTPRQCSRTWPNEPKSIFSNIGTIMSQMSAATGRLTLATSAVATAAKKPGMTCPSATPATMQSATQRVRYRSKSPMGYATSSLERDAPSERPISRSLMPSDSLSMLLSGRFTKVAIRFFR